MKRLLVILFALALLSACVPTPEQEFVVNKGDNAAEQKLHATPISEAADPTEDAPQNVPEETAPTLQAQRFPAHWSDTAVINEWLSITYDADIIQKADGLYPVFRTRRERLTQDQIGAMLEKLLPKPKTVYTETSTKNDWAEEYRLWMEMIAQQQAWVDAGRPNDGVDREEIDLSPEAIAAQSEWYMERIREAPDAAEEHKISDYRSVTMYAVSTYSLEDGTPVAITATDDGFSFYCGCKGSGCVFSTDQLAWSRSYADAWTKEWKDVTCSREDAEASVLHMLERLDLQGYRITNAQEANLLDFYSERHHYVSSGWEFTLHHDFGGYPIIDTAFYPAVTEDETDAFNEPITHEYLTVFVDETGVRGMSFSCPKSVVGLENENVELLPFDTIQLRIQNALSAWYGRGIDWYKEHGQSAQSEVYRIYLTTQTVRVKDSKDYYEMPCWIVLFDDDELSRRERDNPIVSHFALILNAVDGSIVGY